MNVLDLLTVLVGLAIVAVAVVLKHSPRPGRQCVADDVVALVESGQADGCDFFLCPGEQRRRPHAVRVDGSRVCWSCGHDTPGDKS